MHKSVSAIKIGPIQVHMKIDIHVTESVNLAHTADLMWLADIEMDEMPYPLATA